MKQQKLQKLIVILGPTASGKSGLAYKLCKKFNGYIISADSRQFYKGLDIVTAKWSAQDSIIRKNNILYINEIPHYLIDFLEPTNRFSAAEFQREVKKIIKTTEGAPFLVGGTGLYISAVIDNFRFPKGTPNSRVRKDFEQKSTHELLDILKQYDPESESKLRVERNKRRIVRAIEVCVTTGKPFSEQLVKGTPMYNTLQIGIKWDRQKLYERINARADMQMQLGLIQEIETAYKKYPLAPESFTAIGCKEFIPYMQGNISLNEACEKHKQNNRNYCLKQMRWFKRDPRIHWYEGPIDEHVYQNIAKRIQDFLG